MEACEGALQLRYDHLVAFGETPPAPSFEEYIRSNPRQQMRPSDRYPLYM